MTEVSFDAEEPHPGAVRISSHDAKVNCVDMRRSIERGVRVATLSRHYVIEDLTLGLEKKDIRIPGAQTHATPRLIRKYARIVFRDDDLPVNNFKSLESLLCAFRDAIAGHQSSWRIGILHRDVSVNNIFIRCLDSSRACRGAIVDFDFTFTSSSGARERLRDLLKGTRPFESMNALHRYIKGIRSSPFDYLDDLESFFYVLCWISIGYKAPGVKVDPFPRTLSYWDDRAVYHAAAAKCYTFAVDGKFNEYVSENCGPVLRKLLLRLHAFLKPHVFRKANKAPPGGWPSLEQLGPAAEEDYQTVLQFFDEALVECNGEQRESSKEVTTVGQPAAFAHSEVVLSPHLPGQGNHKISEGSSPLRFAHGAFPASSTFKRKSSSLVEGTPIKKTRSLQ